MESLKLLYPPSGNENQSFVGLSYIDFISLADGYFLYHQRKHVFWERFCGGQRRGLLTVITSCSETSAASETLVHQTLRQLHWEQRGQRVGEAGMSLLDQLIRWSETQEQLRKLAALFSDFKRVQCKQGEQRSWIGVLFHISLSRLLEVVQRI